MLIGITSHMGSTAENGGGYYAYRSSKAALNNAMRGLASDWKRHGVIVTVLHPGWVRTDMGGGNATLSPEVSVRTMCKVIARLESSASGTFLDYAGSEIPW